MTTTVSPNPIAIGQLDAAQAEARLDELSHILVDAVKQGASVNFLAGFSAEQARVFWRTQLPGLASCETQLHVAEQNGRLVATALLMFARQPNAPHRADVGKMLVLSDVRRQGVGRRLLAVVEAAASRAGRTLLMLDTETGSAGDLLYRRCGWTEIGRVPNHALRPNGHPAETTMFFKSLA